MTTTATSHAVAPPHLLEHPGMATEEELMDAVHAAEFLGVHIQTLRKLAKQKRIPAFKVGREWRFRKEALIRWADEQGVTNPDETSCSVLIIDDEEKVCAALARMVERFGCRARQATDGQTGLELVARETPDIILLDLKMPHMNGPQFLAKLRDTHPYLPVVIVTGYPESDLMLEATKYAPVMLLSKPIEQEPLERTIRSFLGEKLSATG